MELFTNLKKILVPVPLNSDFAVPLQQAMQFQRQYGSEIIVLTVVSQYSMFHRIMNPEKQKKHNKKAGRKLKKLVKKHFNGQIPENVTLKTVSGSLISSILKTAKEQHCDLIIIKKAKRIQSRLTHLKTENADKLIAEAICPVFTIMSTPTPEQIKNIMVPLEVLKPNQRKIKWAVSLAKKYNAKLHLVSALKADIKTNKSLAYKQARKIEGQIKKEGVDVEKEILMTQGKSQYRTVLDYATALNPDMMVIMTRKESIIRENYLGSFARELIHNASVPVLSIVPEKEPMPYNAMDPVRKNMRIIKDQDLNK